MSGLINFLSITYYFYAFLTCAIHNSLKEITSRRYVLFFINFIFLSLLMFNAKKHFVFLNFSIVFSFFIFKLILEKRLSIKFTNYIVLFFILALIFFKFSHFNQVVIQYFSPLGQMLKPATFVGISFFTFRLLSIAFDIQRNKISENFYFIDYYNFLVFFPTFFSGPLDRFERFKSDLHKENVFSISTLYQNCYRVILGAFKKGIIADNLYSLSIDSMNPAYVAQLPLLKICLAMYIYMFVLYFDFSGYSDIAIGISRLFGISTPENFKSPYTSRNLYEFWNRWHISLMVWLREYVFLPVQIKIVHLKVNNLLAAAMIANTFTFIIAGVWHGDNLNYFLYGLSHAISFNIFFIYKYYLEKKFQKEQIKKYLSNPYIRLAGIFLTFHYFFFSLFFFTNNWKIFIK